jgi:ABC-type antimicrobial peptide transport system permease subunit
MAMRVDDGAPITPTTLRGRLPERTGEIMLGDSTAAALRAHVGSTIPIRFVNGSPVPVRVVGIGAFPTLSDALGLGRGGMTTVSTLLSTLPHGVRPPAADTMLVRFGPSVDRNQAMEDLNRRVSAQGNYAVLAAQRPVDLVNFGRVRSLPLVLATLLAVFAALTLVHLLVTSIRRRRRDFAMLRALGFTARQISGTVAVLATTLVAFALVVGVPTGIVVGRLLWHAFAHNLGILYRPVTPVLAIVLVVPLSVVIGILIAFASSRRVRHADPATVLHTE